VSVWLWLCVARASDPPASDGAESPVEEAMVSEVSRAEGLAAFEVVHEVLVSPRCANCHPVGDVPTVGDAWQPHPMGITRSSPEVGLPCATCHRVEGLQRPRVPPANGHWGLPPRNQVFAGRSPSELCEQLKDPERTGGRDLAALSQHVTNDSLVLWGWSPGPGRTLPPHDHDAFVAAMQAWVSAGGPCP
jgi:hypothetical protein